MESKIKKNILKTNENIKKELVEAYKKNANEIIKIDEQISNLIKQKKELEHDINKINNKLVIVNDYEELLRYYNDKK